MAAAGAQPFAGCERQYDQAPAAKESAECFYRVGRQEERQAEAGALLSRRLADQPDNHWLRYYLGHVYWFDDRPRAIDWYAKAAAGFAARGNATGEVMARSAAYTLLVLEGRTTEAALQVERVEELAAASADPELRARAHLLEARHLWDNTEDLGRAERLLRRAERLVFPSGPYALQSDCLLRLSNVALEQGELDRSIAYSRRLAPLARKAGDADTLAAVLHNIANAVRLQLEESPREAGRRAAVELARQALAAAISAGHREAEVSSLRLLGALLTADAASRDEARRTFARCLVQARRYDLRQETGHCLWESARLLGKEDPARARSAARQALAIVLEQGDPAYVAFAWRQKMRADWLSEDPAAALAESMEALRAVERLRDRQRGERSRAGLLSKWTADYYFVAGQLLRQAAPMGAGEELAAAFEIVERMRAQTLLEAALDSREAASLHAVRARLSPRQALVSFQLGLWEDLYGDFGGGAWVVVATAGAARAFVLPERTRLDSAVEIFLGLVKRRDGSEAAFGARLYELLLAEALASLPPEVDELIIVPDEALHRLPFGALVDKATARPLVWRFRLSLVPSATLWLRWRERRGGPLRPSMLAFADPEPGLVDARDEEAEERSGAALDPRSLGRLPYARREGRSLMSRFGHPSRVLFDAEASELSLKAADLSRYGVVHFAAHALVDGRNPDRSAIVLTPGSPAEDGFLRPAEIAGLGFHGQLVGLSACQSAGGGFVRGEGVMSLARGFVRAGAQAVVGSLWSLRDEEAAWLFDAFYRRIVAGDTASTALRATQRASIERGLPAAAWAGLVLIGDSGTSLVPGDPDRGATASWPTWLAGLAAAGLGLLALRLQHRRRQATRSRH
jgi:CHAT domain-containing protein